MNTNTPSELDVQTLLTELQGGWSEIKSLPATFKTLQSDNAEMRNQLNQLRLSSASRSSLHAPTLYAPTLQRSPGRVSDECALHIASQFVALCEKSGKLEALCSSHSQREAILSMARSTLDLTTRAALTATDVPLPVHYGSELRELISQFGVARRCMSPYPIGMGTAKPARMGTRPTFSAVAMSGAFNEKSPAITLASLESHKLGGIVRLPREIDEQSILPMGQFLARYGAIEFARAEDQWAFLADGSATYDSVTGIVPTASTKGTALNLAAGKTKPSDATLDDFRALRRLVNKAALNGRLSAYYLDTTWETRLPAFKTQTEPNVYQRLPDGSAILDGYPIVWTDVLEPYGTAASAGKPIAVFGALSFWWMGEHGHPRIDNSDQVFFVNDQLAVRFIEEIDFDYAAPDATAALLTAAS